MKYKQSRQAAKGRGHETTYDVAPLEKVLYRDDKTGEVKWSRPIKPSKPTRLSRTSNRWLYKELKKSERRHKQHSN